MTISSNISLVNDDTVRDNSQWRTSVPVVGVLCTISFIFRFATSYGPAAVVPAWSTVPVCYTGTPVPGLEVGPNLHIDELTRDT